MFKVAQKCSSDHKKVSLQISPQEEKMGSAGEQWWQSQFIVNAFNVQSHSPIFNLPVNPPELSISSVTRASSTRTQSFITLLKFPSSLHLMILHTIIISDSEAVKGSCVSSQTAKNSQTNAPKLTADNTEGRLLSGKKSILSHTGGAIIPQGCKMGALPAGVKKLVKLGVCLGGNSHCPWFWSPPSKPLPQHMHFTLRFIVVLHRQKSVWVITEQIHTNNWYKFK